MPTHTQAIQLPPDAHILVVKLATIGDLLLATPALRALREKYPQARIDLLVTPASAGVLDGWDVINRVIVLDKYLFDYPQQLLTKPTNLKGCNHFCMICGRPLRCCSLDASSDAFLGRKHQFLMRATGAKHRVGLDNGHGWFLNVRVEDRALGLCTKPSIVSLWRGQSAAKTDETWLTMPLTAEDRQQARELVFGETPAEDVARPIIAMHPGSGGYSTARRWSPERFAQLADTLYGDTGGQLLLVGGPEEAELHHADYGYDAFGHARAQSGRERQHQSDGSRA